MSTTFKRWGQSELLPRYIFADSIIAHQRILEIGAVASTEGMSAYFLLLKNARTVVACDSSLEATQRAQAKLGAPHLTFRPMVFDGFASGSFDLIAIADLAPFIRAPTFFEQIVRLLAPRGYILGGLRNAAGLALSQVMEVDTEEVPPSYGQLRDLLEPRFPSIQVATQAPVLGYQLAFEAGEGLQIDGSLASSGEAAYYVVIAGAEPRQGIEPLWVQLPPEPLAFNGAKLEEATLRARNWQFRFEEQKEVFERTKAQLVMLEQTNQHQARQLGEAKEALAHFQAQPGAPVFDISANLELSEKVSKLGADLLMAEGRATEAEARVSSMSMEVQRHVQALREATTDLLAAKESTRMEREKREEAEAKAKEAMERITHLQEQTASPSLSTLPVVDDVEFEQTKREVELQRAAMEVLRSELEGLREKHLRAVKAQKESAAAAAEKDSLLQKLQEQERAVHMLQSDLCAMREERDALVFQFRLSGDASKETQEMVAPAGDVASPSRDEEMHRLDARIQELESNLIQKNDEVEAMREDLALRSHSVERSKHRIRELESMLANAQAQSKEDNALLGAEYDKLKQENVDLRSMLESLRTRLEDGRSEETAVDGYTAGAMLAALRQRYAEQEQVLMQTRESLEKAENELEVLHRQLRTFSQERGELGVPSEMVEEAEYIDGIDEVSWEQEK